MIDRLDNEGGGNQILDVEESEILRTAPQNKSQVAQFLCDLLKIKSCIST